MAPDGARKGFHESDYDVRSNNHAILTFTRCPSMFYLERTGTPADADIDSLCGPGGVEERSFVEVCNYFNPEMKCRALKLPPRKSQDDICCQWEFKVEFYRISPMAEGQYNAGYFELMASVTNRAGAKVGYCFVELLPGVRQDGKLKFNFLSLLRKN
jgi:hypothetical protein